MTDRRKEIRLALEKDKQQVEDLWKYCFSDSEEFVEYYFSERYSANNTLCLFVDDKLEAALQLNPYNLVIGDIITEVRYIVGVSVWPEARGRGYMTDLIRSALNMQYQNGEEFSILMPIDTRLYAKYGYVNCFHRHEFLVDLARIETRPSNYQVKRVDVRQAESIEHVMHNLSHVYYNVISENHSYISRNSRYWKNRITELAIDKGEFFTVCDGLFPKGYLMMIAKNSDGLGNVLEMAFCDEEAYHALMGLIKSHATQFSRANISTPQHEEFQLMNHYDNQVEHRMKPFMMGRVINAEKVLDTVLFKQHIFGNGAKPSGKLLAIEIEDSYIRANNFVLRCQGNNFVDITRDKEQERSFDAKLKMSVSELAQLYTKTATLRSLRQMDRIQVEGELEVFEEIFGTELASTFVNDYI